MVNQYNFCDYLYLFIYIYPTEIISHIVAQILQNTQRIVSNDMAENRKTTSIFTCRAMAAFLVGTFLLRFIFSSVYFKQIGLSSFHSGILLSASRLAQALGGVSLGYLSDKADIRNTVLAFSYFAFSITPYLLTLPQPVYKCSEKPLNKSIKRNRQKERNDPENPPWLRPVPSFQSSNDIKESKKISQCLKESSRVTEEYARSKELVMKKRKLFETLYRNFTSSKESVGNWFTDHDARQKSQMISNNFAAQNINDTNVSREYTENTSVTFFYLLFIIIVGDFLGGTTLNLLDALFLSRVDDKKEYGKIRLWGNIGQVFTIPLTALITYFKEVEICGIYQSDFKISLYITTVISGVGWLVAIFKVHMPSSKIKNEEKLDEETNTASLKELIKPVGTWSLLTMAFFFGFFAGILSSFLFWTMVTIDPSQANLSIAVANFFRNLAALLMYFFMPSILHAIGYRNALSLSYLGFAAAHVTASLMFNPWLGILVETLSSLAYAMSMAACVSYLGEVAHHSIAVTAQGICPTVLL